jgi:hypothetical protein
VRRYEKELNSILVITAVKAILDGKGKLLQLEQYFGKKMEKRP